MLQIVRDLVNFDPKMARLLLKYLQYFKKLQIFAESVTKFIVLRNLCAGFEDYLQPCQHGDPLGNWEWNIPNNCIDVYKDRNCQTNPRKIDNAEDFKTIYNNFRSYTVCID